MALTEWFPGRIKPVRSGWYSVKYREQRWYYNSEKKYWCKKGTITGIFGIVKRPDYWRGILK